MYLGGDVGEGPSAGEVGGEEKLDAVDGALIAVGAARTASGARTESALEKGEREAFRFEGFGCAFAEAVTEHGDKGLSAGVDAKAMGAEGSG